MQSHCCFGRFLSQGACFFFSNTFLSRGLIIRFCNTREVSVLRSGEPRTPPLGSFKSVKASAASTLANPLTCGPKERPCIVHECWWISISDTVLLPAWLTAGSTCVRIQPSAVKCCNIWRPSCTVFTQPHSLPSTVSLFLSLPPAFSLSQSSIYLSLFQTHTKSSICMTFTLTHTSSKLKVRLNSDVCREEIPPHTHTHIHTLYPLSSSFSISALLPLSCLLPRPLFPG